MRKAGWFAIAALLVAAAWLYRGDLARWRNGQGPMREAGPATGGPEKGEFAPRAASDNNWPAVPELAGSVEIVLGQPPATLLGAVGSETAEDASLRPLVEAIEGVEYSPALSRAAREIAYQAAVLGAPPPEAAMGFLLGSAGAADTNAAQLFVRTNRPDEKVLVESIASAAAAAQATPGRGVLRIGVGEAVAEGHELDRKVVVVASWRDFDIEPTPRAVAAGGEWVLRGRLPRGVIEPTGNVLYPDNTLVSIPARVAGDRFELRVPAGDRRGVMRVGISGVDRRRGPGKILQYQVSVGEEVPTRATVFVPDPAREAFAADELAEAEEFAYSLVMRDRGRYGLPPLERDEALDSIARVHSRDMRDRGFFGHQSPTTGLVSDRLADAGYRSTAHAENLARNDSIAEAQASLMESVGHRRNLLDPSFTRVGIGLARAAVPGGEAGGERAEWHLTQVFAKPVRQISAAEGRRLVVAQVNEQRARRGLPPLSRDDGLDELAQANAGLAAANQLAELRERANRTAYRSIDRLAMITAHQVYDIESFDVPDTVFDERMGTLGVGALQSADDLSGRIGVVLIVAE